ncbi:2Fe-2S iron-sulfur cluster binding domain-containing protein [Synechococcus sp. RSCCF101]|uniref:2Fe-2S iron-sulfur cluster-binding protein n=1 Tax=Synechococcus sp. RSCCF101 TaxID=2511069 RepID=UPI0012459837|nr:2Fe-2S iron-sulfur cluster-binding protein [Synechococcus sp. RSCCF101]QEY33134.1 2Fe-2S iron-sulfur cluster binding domain-containing protein [Synechococcus sp. RSCCF101]
MNAASTPSASEIYGRALPPHPVEGAVAGLAAGVILGFTAGAWLAGGGGAMGARTEQRLALGAGGMAFGGAAGLVDVGLRRRRFRAEAARSWRGWRPFRVIRKQPESREITSFHLAPVDGLPIPTFSPGQFLTIQLPIPGQGRPTVRTYSLSDDLADGSRPGAQYRLSIKREPAPRGLDVPPGRASSWMHDAVEEGSTLLCRPPAGAFVLHGDRDRPIALVSNGVGITPMLTMARAARRLGLQQPIWFIHGARDGSHQAFSSEIRDLAAPGPAGVPAPVHVHLAYSRPRPEDEGRYQSRGRVDAALLQRLLPEDADIYLCGSPPFMEGMLAALRQVRGGDGEAIEGVFFEVFTPAPRPQHPDPADGSAAGQAAEVTFHRSGREARWAEAAGSLLELAEDQGLTPPFACRAGVCGTCRCRVLEGAVETTATPSAPLGEGEALICISRPAGGRVVLDL